METKIFFNDSDVGYIDPDFYDEKSVDESTEKVDINKEEKK